MPKSIPASWTATGDDVGTSVSFTPRVKLLNSVPKSAPEVEFKSVEALKEKYRFPRVVWAKGSGWSVKLLRGEVRGVERERET